MKVGAGSGSAIQYICKYFNDRTEPSLSLQMTSKWMEREMSGKEEPPFVLRNLERLKNWTNKNCMNFNKNK